MICDFSINSYTLFILTTTKLCKQVKLLQLDKFIFIHSFMIYYFIYQYNKCKLRIMSSKNSIILIKNLMKYKNGSVVSSSLLDFLMITLNVCKLSRNHIPPLTYFTISMKHLNRSNNNIANSLTMY